MVCFLRHKRTEVSGRSLFESMVGKSAWKEQNCGYLWFQFSKNQLYIMQDSSVRPQVSQDSLEQKIASASGDEAQLRSRITLCKQQYQQLKEECENRQRRSIELTKIKEQKQQQLTDKQAELQYAQQEITKLQNKCHKAKVQMQNQLRQQQQQQRQLQQLEEDKKAREHVLIQLNTQKHSLQETLSTLTRENNRQASQKVSQQHRDYKAELQQCQQQTQKLQQTYQRIQAELQATRHRHSDLKTELEQLQQQLTERQRIVELAPQEEPVQHPDYGHLFAGDILEGNHEARLYLVQLLQKRTGRTINKTKLLYRHDLLNPNNFHAYLDDHPQLVVLIRLKNGYLLGAWSEGPFLPNHKATHDGLIFSLTNRQAFQPLRANQKATVYDEYFLMWGNSELRLRSRDTKVYSNLGINQSYYQNEGQSVDVLLGSGKEREVELQQLEAYQLQFSR